MIHIIYMAAGNSRRFGSNKLLYVWHGKKLYRHTLDMLLKIKQKSDDIVSLTVVTQYSEIISELEDKEEINVVFSNESRLGASYTIKSGIKSLKGQCKKDEYIMFVVADQPYLSEDTICKFIKIVQKKCSDGYKVFSVRYGDKVGNPCMFRAELIPELLKLEGDSGGRKVAKKHDCCYIEIKNKMELYDIDTVWNLKI